MEGERCEICECMHEEDNPVVLDEKRLICLECIGDMDEL